MKNLIIIILFVHAWCLNIHAQSFEVNTKVVNVISSLGKDAKIIGQLKEHDKINVINQADGWAQIRYAGQIAYVDLSSISQDSHSSTSEPVSAPYPQPMQQPVDVNHLQLVYHEVKRGETIVQIAGKYNVSVNDIIKWNKLTSSSLASGKRLKLQISTQTIDNARESAYHEVKQGESIVQIAKKYDLNVADIIAWNKLTSTSLVPGTKLKIRNQ